MGMTEKTWRDEVPSFTLERVGSGNEDEVVRLARWEGKGEERYCFIVVKRVSLPLPDDYWEYQVFLAAAGREGIDYGVGKPPS